MTADTISRSDLLYRTAIGWIAAISTVWRTVHADICRRSEPFATAGIALSVITASTRTGLQDAARDDQRHDRAGRRDRGAQSYVIVFQATDSLQLQPVIGGRNYDRFERVDGVWRFRERRIESDLMGDLSAHMLQAIPDPYQSPDLVTIQDAASRAPTLPRGPAQAGRWSRSAFSRRVPPMA
jgi:hypothetical protein